MWNIAIQPIVGCSGLWANMHCSGCSSLRKQSENIIPPAPKCRDKKLWNKTIGGHVSYPNDSPTTARLGLCSSLEHKRHHKCGCYNSACWRVQSRVRSILDIFWSFFFKVLATDVTYTACPNWWDMDFQSLNEFQSLTTVLALSCDDKNDNTYDLEWRRHMNMSFCNGNRVNALEWVSHIKIKFKNKESVISTRTQCPETVQSLLFKITHFIMYYSNMYGICIYIQFSFKKCICRYHLLYAVQFA